MSIPIDGEYLEVPVIEGRVLGVKVYRGYAPLCELARISRADIYDQKTNPTGTQRDLSAKHAKDAYEYVRNREFAFWPEVFLCTRSKDVVEFQRSGDSPFGMLRIDKKLVRGSPSIMISRVDGNHRLHYADGSSAGYTPIEKSVSFCLAYDLSPEQEIMLFRDINDNQMRMSTSHLDNIQSRLTPQEELKRREPALYIAQTLGKESDSPLYQRIYEGGKKHGGSAIPLRTLKTGIQYMLSKPTKLTALKDPEAQYKVIKNFFEAVKRWEPNGWNEPKKYLLLRGAGLWGVCFIGADVIDKVLTKGDFRAQEMVRILQSGKRWDWSNKGDFQGLSGRGGAVKIRDLVVAEIQDESGISVKELYRRIMNP